MNFSLTNEQKDLFDEVQQKVEETINELTFIKDQSRPFSKSDWEQCGKLGLLGLPIPKEFGGRGFDAITTAVGLEALGFSCNDAGLPFAIAAQTLSCLIPVSQFGNKEQKSSYLPRLCSGEMIMANSITEKNSGSDVYNMVSEAERKGDFYILNGEKTMITNAPIADISLVYMATNKTKGFFGGITAFLVNHSLKGVDSTDRMEKIGMESVQMGSQKFKNVKLKTAGRLGKEGAGGPIFKLSMDWERACLGAIHVGLMKKITEATIQYAKKRKVGQTTIGKKQVISHKIADMEVRLQSSQMMLYRAAWGLDHERDPGKAASISKLYISKALQKTCLDSFSIMGGAAYLKGSFIESYLRSSLSATIYSGTSEIQKDIISSYSGL